MIRFPSPSSLARRAGRAVSRLAAVALAIASAIADPAAAQEGAAIPTPSQLLATLNRADLSGYTAVVLPHAAMDVRGGPGFETGYRRLLRTDNLHRQMLDGYMLPGDRPKLAGSPSAVVQTVGRGRVVYLADDVTFRGQRDGLNGLFLNALLFGPLL